MHNNRKQPRLSSGISRVFLTVAVCYASSAVWPSDSYAQSAKSLSLAAPVVTISEESEDGTWLISGIGGAVLLKNGGYAIGDGTVIHIFDARGRHLRVVGGKGQGPGEFVSISGFAECSEGILVVTDSRQRRVTVVGSGRPETAPYPNNVAPSITPTKCLGNEAVFLDHAQDMNRPAPSSVHVMRQDTVLVIRGTRSMKVRDTLVRVAGARSLDGLNAPFSVAAAISMNDRVVVTGTTGDSVLTITPRAGGATTRVVVRGLPVRPVTAKMKSDRIAYSKKNTPPSIWEGELGAIFERLVWPSTLPLWSGVYVDDVSRIWILEGARPEPNAVQGAMKWRVLNGSGLTAFTLTLPPTDRLLAVRRNEAVIIHRNEDDTNTLVVRPLRGW